MHETTTTTTTTTLLIDSDAILNLYISSWVNSQDDKLLNTCKISHGLWCDIIFIHWVVCLLSPYQGLHGYPVENTQLVG
jgi:hypothetical protein